ncbi:MAG: hypothetical protein ACRBFS_08645 [Aureispira sp.]
MKHSFDALPPTLLPVLQEWETKRQLIIKKARWELVFSFSINLVLLVLMGSYLLQKMNKEGDSFFLAYVYFFITMFVVFVIDRGIRSSFVEQKQAFEHTLKETIYAILFQNQIPSKKAAPLNITDLLQEAQFYPYYEGYKKGPCCEGQVNDGRAFQVVELQVGGNKNRIFHKTTTGDAKGFNGLFLRLEGPHVLQDIASNILILPQKRSKIAKKQVFRPQAEPIDLILDANLPATSLSTEQALFDRSYQIKGAPAFRTLQQLSPAFLKQLLGIPTDLSHQFALSFQKNVIYILILSPFKFWKADVSLSLISPPRLQHLAWTVKAVTGTLESIATVTTRPTNS